MSKLLEQTLKKLQKDYGEAISDVNDTGIVKRIITSSPNMNYVLGGGIPRGRISVLMGLESTGKCYSPDTMVLTNSGYKSFKELFSDQGISLDEKEEVIPVETDIAVLNHEGNWSKISNFTKNGIKQTKIIETRSGAKVQATLNNPFLVASPNGNTEWKCLEDITTDDYLVQHRNSAYILKNWNEEAYVLGVLIADGYFNKNYISICNNDPNIIQIIEMYFSKYIGEMCRATRNSSEVFTTKCTKTVRDFYKKYGISYGVAKNKKVPSKVFSEDKDFIASFLMGYFDCESYISRSLEVSSASKQLLEEIYLLLNQLGYKSFLRTKKVKSYLNNWYGRLYIYGSDFEKFATNIGFKSNVKKNQMKNFVYKQETNHDSIPLCHDLFLDILLSIESRNRETWNTFSEILDQRCNASFNSLQKVYNYLVEHNLNDQAKRIKEFIDCKYYYDKVVDIQDGGKIITCDIEVLDSHSFVANGIIAHNTILASYLAGQVQKQKDYPNVVCYIDMEHTFDKNYASVVGLDTEDDSKFIFVRPKHGEEGFEIMKSLAETGEIGMFVWDSVAATPSAKALAKEVGSATFGGTASVMADGLKIINPILSRYKVPTIFLNQVRCISKDTLVNINGTLQPFENVKVGDKIYDKEVINILDSGLLDGVDLRIKYRPNFKISNNHKQPIISKNGYEIKVGSEIREGDWIIQPIISGFENNNTYLDISFANKNPEKSFPKILDEDMGFILGIYYSDGSFREYDTKKDYGISWTENNKERFNLVKNVLQKKFNNVNIREHLSAITLLGKDYLEFFKNLGCLRYGKNKNIPECILQSPFSVQREFIRGAFFDTHGFCDKGFIFSNENIDSLNQFSTLLYTYGIFSDIRGHYLYITSDDAIRFNNLFGFAEESKQQKATTMFTGSKNSRGKYDVVPYFLGVKILEYVKKVSTKKISSFRGYSSLAQYKHNKLNFCRKSLINYITNCEVPPNFEIELVCNNRFSIIQDINRIKIDAIDIEVTGNSLFIASQFLTHNSKIGGMPGYGPQENMKVGGYALPFYSSWSAKVSRVEDIIDKKETIGIKMRVKNIKSKIGIPKRSVELDLYYQTGFNPDMEYIDFIINFGYVQKAGAWLSNDEWNIKVQGRNGLLDYLKTNQDLFESLKKEINESFSKTTVLDLEGEESSSEDADDNVDPLFA